MPRIERTAEIVWDGEPCPGRGIDLGGDRRLCRAPVLERDPDRRARGQDEPGGAARGGARRLLRELARGRADQARASARPPAGRLHDRHGRGRGPGASDRRLAAHGRRLGRRARQRDVRRGGRGRRPGLPVLGAPAPCRRHGDDRRVPCPGLSCGPLERQPGGPVGTAVLRVKGRPEPTSPSGRAASRDANRGAAAGGLPVRAPAPAQAARCTTAVWAESARSSSSSASSRRPSAFSRSASAR